MDDRNNKQSPYSISDDEEAHELEIKPPQAKIAKHTRHCREYFSSSKEGYGKSRYDREKYRVKHRNATNRKYEKYRETDEYRHKRPHKNDTVSKRSRHKECYEDSVENDNEISDYFREHNVRDETGRRSQHHRHSEKENDKRKYEKHEERSRKKLEDRETSDRKHCRHVQKKLKSSEKFRDDEKQPEKPKYSRKHIVIDVETSPIVLREEYPDKNADHNLEEGEVISNNSISEDGSENGKSKNIYSNSNSSAHDTSSSSSSSNGENSSSDSFSETDDHEEKEEQEKANVQIIEEDVKIKDESPLIVSDTKVEKPEILLPSYFPAIQGCRSVEEFQCLNRIAEGTYGVVYRARELRTDQIVALKRLKMEKEKEGFPITSLREVNTLLKAQHPNIVPVKEIVVGSNMDKIYIVMEFIEHDLKSVMETMKEKKMKFKASEVKCLLHQLLRAVDHLHDNWILHRDLKTSNLLLSDSGVLKVGDFGLAREYGSPLKHYTPIVVTLWYRAPELLLGAREYSTKVDMWSVGCIFAEMLRMNPLFEGRDEMEQLKRIFKVFGTPTKEIWPEYPDLPILKHIQIPQIRGKGLESVFKMLTATGYDLLMELLTYNPKKRISADGALEHHYFREHPQPVKPTMFKLWPSKSGTIKGNSPKAPSGGQNYKDLEEDDGFSIGSGEDMNAYSLKSTFCLKF